MEELKDYVKEMKKQGYSKDSIKQRLELEGFEEHHITNALNGRPVTLLLAILLVIVLLVGLGTTMLSLLQGVDMAPQPVQTCNDRDCFTDRALDCLPTVYTQRESTSTIQYSIRGCELTKKVIAIDDRESAVIKNYFLNKDMKCDYPRDQFKRTWLLGITSGMEDCYGSLRDALELI